MTELHLPWRYDSTIHAIVDTRWDWMRHQGGDHRGIVFAHYEAPDAVVCKAIVEAVNRYGELIV